MSKSISDDLKKRLFLHFTKYMYTKLEYVLDNHWFDFWCKTLAN